MQNDGCWGSEAVCFQCVETRLNRIEHVADDRPGA